MLVCELHRVMLKESGYEYWESSPNVYNFTTDSGIDMFAESHISSHPEFGRMLIFTFGFDSPRQVGASSPLQHKSTNPKDTVTLFHTLLSIIKRTLDKRKNDFDTLEFDTTDRSLVKVYDLYVPRILKLMPSDFKFFDRDSHGTKVYLFSRMPILGQNPVQRAPPDKKQKSIFSRLFRN